MKQTNAHPRENSPEAILTQAAEALAVLRKTGCGLDDFLDQYASSSLQRRRLSSLLFAYFRHKSVVDLAISKCCSKAPQIELQEFLAAALTMACRQDSLVPESVVNIAVTAAKKRFNAAVGRFVNAVLRKSIKLIPELRVNPLPPAILRQWQQNFSPEDVQSLAELFTIPPASTVRLRYGFEFNNDPQLKPIELALPWKFYQCSQLKDLLSGADFQSGKYYIQDPAPGHVCALLQQYHQLLPPELTMLDLCAAPGGKLIMNVELLSMLGLNLRRVIAFDRSPRRLELVRENCLRCNVQAETMAGDGADQRVLAGESFDLVTCDVPCSNSGVFRHRPDALWRWQLREMQEITALQQKILDNAARLTAVDGVLLYSTCSLEKEENTLQIHKFLSRNCGFELLEEKLFMPQSCCDGTYAAILHKKSGN